MTVVCLMLVIACPNREIYMTAKLFFSAICKFLLGVILVGGCVFVSAGTWRFINGWLLMGVLFVPMFVAGVVMMIKNPLLLQKRLNAKEKEHEQRLVVKFSGLMFLIGFTVAGLGYRFGWYVLPMGISIGAMVVFVIAYALYAEVLRENTYLSRTIEVQQGQKVIDTGLYGVVRHPMYSVTLFLFLSMPLILGSVYAFALFLTYPLMIAKRIRGEERLLEQALDGYYEYTERVKYRLIPWVW